MVPSNLFVCIMGLTVVFISLIFMVLICHLTHWICDKITTYLDHKKNKTKSFHSN